MKFRQIKDDVKWKGEKLSEGSDVEQIGYVDVKKQVEAFIDAGRRLDNYRKELYDIAPNATPEEEDEAVIDPTRNPNYDMADASQDMLIAEFNMRNSGPAPEQKKEKKPKVEPIEKEGVDVAREALEEA